MHHYDLKKLLLETCQVLPGQEARAWSDLKERLYPKTQPRSVWRWIYVPTWRGLAVAVMVLALMSFAGIFFSAQPLAMATADSQSAGIYATAFYSRPAKAQVIWLNGMDPATDRPTYLDPTTQIKRGKPDRQPIGDPNSL